MEVFPPPLFQEGLFLRPHHFQLEQRHRETAATAERSFLHPHPYGVFALELDVDILRAPLQQRALSFRRLHAVMPASGRVVMFEADGGDTRLSPLPLPDSLGPYDGVLQVWLAVPRQNPGRPNVEDAAGERMEGDLRLFAPLVREVNDENIGRNRQAVLLRQTCAFLIMGRVGAEPRGDIEALPLLRLIDAPNEEQRGELILDATYCGPSLLLAAQPEMMRQWDLFVRYAAGQRQAVENRVRPRFAIEGMNFAGWRRLQKLQILNIHVPRLGSIGRAPGATPWQAWLELAAMHGALAGLYPEHLVWEEPDFNAANPLSSFLSVMSRIRSFLDAESAPLFREIEFYPDAEGTPCCQLGERYRDVEAARQNEFYLAVRSDGGDREAIRREVSDARRFKVMAASEVGRAVFGIPLRHEAFPPEDMPRRGDMLVFRMDRDEKNEHLWEKALQEGKLAVSAVAKQNLEAQSGAPVTFALFVLTPQKG